MNNNPGVKKNKPRTVVLSVAATIFSILYARGLTTGQINVLGNLFQAIGEQMATISSIVRAPFDEGEEDRIISNMSRNQYMFLSQRLTTMKQELLSKNGYFDNQ